MTALVDTNVALRTCLASDPLHVALLERQAAMISAGDVLVICAQVVYESWVILTRPVSGNGFGQTVRTADKEISKLVMTYALMPDPPDLLERWRRLCVSEGVVGKQAHDARLVALMHATGLQALLTLNREDFGRYPGIVLL